MKLNKENKTLIEFITLFSKLPPAQLVGVTKILQVATLLPIEEEGALPQVRSMDEVLSDSIDAFCAMPRKRRRELLSIIKKAMTK